MKVKKHLVFTPFSILALVGMVYLAPTSGFSSETMEGKSIKLFNGFNLCDWRGHRDNNQWFVAKDVSVSAKDNKLFDIEQGQGIMVNSYNGRTCNLLSRYEHGDCKLHIEFVVPHNSNSGVYFHGMYEVQVLDSYGKKDEDLSFSDCGGIYARWDGKKTYHGFAPKTNQSKAPGEWQSFDVIFRAPRFDEDGKKVENARFVEVKHNGVVIHKDVELTGSTRAALNDRPDAPEHPKGPLMLQGDHGPVAYRNIILTPLNLD